MRYAPSHLDRSPQLLLLALACLLAGANAATADLNDGLVGYWSFDAGTAHDDTGHGHEGVIHGATVATGVAGDCLFFDGSDYIQFATPVENAPPYTVYAWIKPTSLTGDRRHIAGNGGQTAVSFGLTLNLRPNGDSRFVAKRSDGTHTVLNVPLLSLGWTSLCGTWDGSADVGSARLYVNGSLQAIGTPSPSSTGPAQNLRIGCPSNALNYFFHGHIDEVRIYDRVLSEDEIRQLYEWTPRPEPESDYVDGDKSKVSGTSADPVNTATGSFFHQETDLSISSRGLPLTFTRFYNSKAAKSRQVPVERKTATSQPASKNNGERSSIDAKKHSEFPTSKKQDQAAGSLQPRPKAEKSK